MEAAADVNPEPAGGFDLALGVSNLHRRVVGLDRAADENDRRDLRTRRTAHR